MNNIQDNQRQPLEDCFAAKQNSIFHTSKRSQNISCEMDETNNTSSSSNERGNIVEENIDDLTKMLEPKYIIDRNHVIDSNHNIDKINNLKYLLNPTFNGIRHLPLLNNKRITCKNFPKLFESKFISYQNLETESITSCEKIIDNFNTMSDPVLNAPSSTIRVPKLLFLKGNSEMSSVSDPNIKSPLVTQTTNNEKYRYSFQNLDFKPIEQMYHRNPFYSKMNKRCGSEDVKLVFTNNGRLFHTRKQLRILKHSESVNTIGTINQTKSSTPRPMNSEPPSPIPLESLREEDTRIFECTKLSKSRSSKIQQIERHSDPVIPSALLSIKGCSVYGSKSSTITSIRSYNEIPTHEFINPIELFEALLRNPNRSRRDISLRRPSSDSRWSESSRSQENLPSLPLSHSINHFQT